MHSVRSCRIDSVRWIFLFMFLTIACRPLMAAAAAIKVVTEADNGGTVHLKAGDVLEPCLESNPGSTGYMWYVDPKSTPLLKLIGQSQTQPTQPGVGKPISQIFVFQAMQSGQGDFLLHIRSWEKPAQAEKQFLLHVLIK